MCDGTFTFSVILVRASMEKYCERSSDSWGHFQYWQKVRHMTHKFVWKKQVQQQSNG